ncbi:MAG: CopD family protein [Campylobacterota bacterium]|nr:CopD family protein [Campylobacterota bacterium]
MYEWTLWFHVISFISWFAVLFYLPRLFVYHAEHADNAGFIEVVKIQEMKLYKYIGIPSMWTTILSGVALVFMGEWFTAWLYLKVVFLVMLVVYFLSLGVLREKLLVDECSKSGKFFRFYNEVPTLLMLLIVAMVVFKPF